MNTQPPKNTGLLEFLKASVGCQFVIPVYQRNYTWTANKEVKQYFEDLKNILNGKYSKHFMGILIYLDTPLDYASREFSVIDGQQRLTTTFLILYAIKNLMLQDKLDNEAAKLNDQFLENKYVSDKLKFKLKPLVSDDEVYQKIIINDLTDIKEVNSNVYKNYNWIITELRKLLKEFSYNDILVALDKLYVVCVPVRKEDSPQKIFESINSTGAKLVASDLIRNYILMDITSDIQERYYNFYWKKLEEYLTSDSKKLEAFFRMFLACKNKFLSNITTVYNDFKLWYSFELQKTNDAEKILKEIVRYARYYSNIYNKPINEVDSNLKNVINEYRSNLSEMPAPFLMELYSLYETIDEEGKTLITSNQFNEMIQLINIYLIRRAICGYDTSDITRLFPLLLKDVLLECNGNYEKIVEYTKKHLVNKNRGKSAVMPDNEQVRTILEFSNVYNLRITLRIILNKMETIDNPAPVDLSKLSVEHLMPQTPTKEWLDALKCDEITYSRYLHRIGNLTLASKVDNSKMKNKVWDYKKTILENTSHLTMNQEILKKEFWTLEEIDQRNKQMIERFIELYPYQAAPDEVIAKHEIFLDWDGVRATAFFYEEDGSVEVQAGSEIVKYDKSKNYEEWQYDVYNQLLEDNIIKEIENGAIFIRSYMFSPQMKNRTSLSESAGLILCGSRNGWEYWKDSFGKPLNQNTKLKNKMTGKGDH